MTEQKIVVDIDWDQNYGAGSTQIPVCLATHSTLEGMKDFYRSALGFHLEGMREDGDVIPEAQRFKLKDLSSKFKESSSITE